jgi:drug/metabolite transporter (DMT)-like permease
MGKDRLLKTAVAQKTPVAWMEMSLRLSKSTLVLLAFGSVYLFWGSTYGAIHIAGEHLPVPVVSATRSLISATLLGVICLVRGKSLRVPKGEGWKLVVVGLLFMSCNNMLLTWGEKLVPSGFASLIVSTMPIMIALIEMVLPDGDALNKRGWAGTILGTLGIGVLVWPSLRAGAAHGGSQALLGVIVLLGAALAFAIGSILSRRFHFTADTFVATGWQIGAAGIFNATLALATGGWHRAVWTWPGFGSIVYLSIFGSVFGLVAFTYLLQNVAVTKVSTYAFVNPLIAVLLGVLLFHERLVKAEIVGMAVIVCAVAMVVYSRVDRGKREIVGMAGEAVE